MAMCKLNVDVNFGIVTLDKFCEMHAVAFYAYILAHCWIDFLAQISSKVAS